MVYENGTFDYDITLFGVSVVNSWLLYKKCQLQNNDPVIYTFTDWRAEIGSSLTNTGVCIPTKGRRLNSLESLLKMVIRTRAIKIQTKYTRLDNTGLICQDHRPKEKGVR